MASNNNGDSKPRPTEYTAEIGTAICERLVEGQSIYRICSDPTMPSGATLREWLAKHEDFRKEFAFAEWFMAQWFEDELIEIVDSLGHLVEKVRSDGKVVAVIDPKAFARSRLRLDVRCWVADQRAPNNPVKFSIPRKGYGK